MTKKQSEKPKRRTQVKELPKNEKELSKGEQKKIKGGPRNSNFFVNVGRTDDSGN
ncbi:MAG TPA: hypothetical protein VGB73_09290 [Pyrinomonadaceae bacterium]|jgi:hypothetical protein